MLLEWKTISLAVIFGVIYNIAFVFIPMFQGRLLDSVIGASPITAVLLSAGIFMSVVILTQVARYIKRYFVRSFANRTKRTMRLRMYSNTVNQPISTLDNIEIGDLMTRCIGDVDITVEGIRKCLTEILDTGIAMVAYIAMLLVYDPLATLLACSFIIIAMLIALLLKTTVYKYNNAYRQASTKFANNTYELTSNATLLRTYGALDGRISKFESIAKDAKTKSVKASLIENSLPPIYKIIASIGVIFVICAGGKKTLDSIWTIGTFTAYLTLFLAFTLKASKISKLFNSAQKAKISWLRIKDYFGEESVDSAAQVSNISVDNLIARDMTIAYDDGAQVFEKVDITAKVGEIIGLRGKIASGKSSCLLALSGLYGYGGSVRVNGVELRDYDRREISGMISYSAHNAYLLDDTIGENISVGRECDIGALLADVCFDKDLDSMPNGIMTIVGNNGVRLSGGQQARISLARSLVGSNKIVLLDDPFSAVDSVTEKNIIANLRANHSDKIFIIASNRPNMCEYADRIVEIIKAKPSQELDEDRGGDTQEKGEESHDKEARNA